MINKLCLFSGQRHQVCSIVCTIPNRHCSNDIKGIKNPDPAFLKRGTGGRSSFNGTVATVFGATGFLGRYLCNELGRRGTQIIIPHRSDPDDYEVKKLKLVGDLGQVLFQPFNLKDPNSIRKCVKYSNVVINLIGSNEETRNFSYNDVHVKGACEIAKACKEANVERLIHFSSLNVTDKPERYYMKKLMFLPSKLEGEKAVMEEFPDTTIFRPSAMYGFFDTFLWPLCSTLRTQVLSTPLYAKGEKTIRQPVFAPDVALGVLNALSNNETKGKIYQAVGPERFYLKDIATFCFQILQRHIYWKDLIHDIKFDPIILAKILVFRNLLGAFHYYPTQYLSFELIERESVTDVVDKRLCTLEDLGVIPQKMEDRVPHLIFKTFKFQADKTRTYEDYVEAESLSSKALITYD